jgi:hypothetical protein
MSVLFRIVQTFDRHAVPDRNGKLDVVASYRANFEASSKRVFGEDFDQDVWLPHRHPINTVQALAYDAMGGGEGRGPISRLISSARAEARRIRGIWSSAGEHR